MSIGTPLPLLSVLPPPPSPTVDDPAAVDATTFVNGLWDARRELFRARGAVFNNCILGGFAPTLTVGTVTIGRGVVQLMIPRAGWSATPSGGQLKVNNPLAGDGVDGAYRAERHGLTVFTVGDGTTGPVANDDSIVYLSYDQTVTDRIAVLYSTVDDAEDIDWTIATPLVWVRTDGSDITLMRDLRVMPPWAPRTVQVRYASLTPPETVAIPSSNPPDGTTSNSYLLPHTDIGSFWLREGEGVLFYVGIQFSGGFGQHPLLACSNMDIAMSRGDPDDDFQDPHHWYGGSRASRILPIWWSSVPMAGRSQQGFYFLFLPRAIGESDVPGVFHFNGVWVPYLLQFGTNQPIHGYTKPVDSVIVKAEVLTRGSRAFMTRRSDITATSFPEIPLVR